MTLNHIKYPFVIFLLLTVVSCSKIDTSLKNPKENVKVGEIVSNHSMFDVQFFSTDSLFVGYNLVYFRLNDKNSGLPLNKATIKLNPLMDMGTMKHACPSEDPAEYADTDGYFAGAVLFSMAGSNNSWSLTIHIDANGVKDTAKFYIPNVVATNPAKKIVVIDSLSNGPGSWTITKYPVSLIEPDIWKVGQNKFEITVHKMASMMSFPCCSDMTVEITPEMPSMGHGSPNNVNPVMTSNGHYAGIVNFTMTGAWRVNMTFKKGDRIIGKKAYFDISF